MFPAISIPLLGSIQVVRSIQKGTSGFWLHQDFNEKRGEVLNRFGCLPLTLGVRLFEHSDVLQFPTQRPRLEQRHRCL